MRVFTICGPSQSGKSTLAGALAGLGDTTDNPLTIADVANVQCFSFMDQRWAALDMTGGTENLAQLGPALSASDAAVVCVPADADAAVLSAPFLRLIEDAGIPAIIFINGLDKASNRISEVVAALQAYCAHHIILRQIPMRENDQIVGAVDLISERAWKYQEGQPSALIELPDSILAREQGARSDLLESLADFDDALLEQLIEDQQPISSNVYDVASRTLQHSDLVPALIGSASHRNGILRLMKSLRHEAPQVDVARDRLAPDGTATATGMVADVVKHLGKTVLVRALGGTVRGGEHLGGATIGSLTATDAKTPVERIEPGEIALTVKSDHVGIGRFYTPHDSAPLPGWAHSRASVFRRLVAPVNDREEARLSSALDKLCEIDPGLAVEQDQQSGQIVLNTQGPLHLRRVVQKIDGQFGIELTQNKVPVGLKETIQKGTEWHYRHRKQSGGAGQFADILIEIRPEPRGSGFSFSDSVKGGAVPRNYIPAVEAGARDALQGGPGGHPVVDVSVVLKDGKHHAVDSSDYAFRTAGKNAVREALANLGTVILQPIMKVQIQVPSIFAGGLVPTISGLKGQVLGFDAHPTAAGWDVFDCLLPMAALDNLYNTLASATRGTAWYTSEFDRYEKVSKEDMAEIDNQMALSA